MAFVPIAEIVGIPLMASSPNSLGEILSSTLTAISRAIYRTVDAINAFPTF